MAAVAQEASSPTMMDTSAEDEITKHFPSVVDATLLSRLNQLCRTHKLSAEQLNTQWEMVCINDGGGGDIKMSMDTIAQLERRCANSSAKATTAAGSRFGSRVPAGKVNVPKQLSTFAKDNKDLLSGGKLSTVTPQRGARPGAPIAPLSLGSPSAGSPASGAFANRQDSGKVVTSVNSLLGPATSFPQLSVEPRLPAEAPSHFMWERMDERARLLDQGVSELEAALLLEPGLPPLRGVTASGEEATVAGRVCGEVDGKLNAKSIFIEGSRGLSNGFRVRLDLSQCRQHVHNKRARLGATASYPGRHFVGHLPSRCAKYYVLATYRPPTPLPGAPSTPSFRGSSSPRWEPTPRGTPSSPRGFSPCRARRRWSAACSGVRRRPSTS